MPVNWRLQQVAAVWKHAFSTWKPPSALSNQVLEQMARAAGTNRQNRWAFLRTAPRRLAWACGVLGVVVMGLLIACGASTKSSC